MITPFVPAASSTVLHVLLIGHVSTQHLFPQEFLTGGRKATVGVTGSKVATDRRFT